MTARALVDQLMCVLIRYCYCGTDSVLIIHPQQNIWATELSGIGSKTFWLCIFGTHSSRVLYNLHPRPRRPKNQHILRNAQLFRATNQQTVQEVKVYFSVNSTFASNFYEKATAVRMKINKCVYVLVLQATPFTERKDLVML